MTLKGPYSSNINIKHVTNTKLKVKKYCGNSTYFSKGIKALYFCMSVLGERIKHSLYKNRYKDLCILV